MTGHQDIESGKTWVETKISEISATIPKPPTALVWQRPEQQMMEQFAWPTIELKVFWGENFEIVEFLEDELQDVEEEVEIQVRLEDRVRHGLASLKAGV